ncbi:zona pellucida sperm-binding protein 3-like [Silurus meridionalis]|uniref:zona pellucida sperm-binding protein 3-like n=1 Tax=Silurus meridionalis TaxID=175797 RepID=UPI001EEC27DD|nr:zona pellucida sperm-binding protein 3-like [Silurus meridionalis]
MGFNQVGLCALVLFAVRLSTAQWMDLGAVQPPAGSQATKPGQPPLQSNPGMAPQWLQSSPQAGSPPVAPLGLQFQNPSDAQGQQIIQQQVKKLDWTFPALPKIPTAQTLVHVDRQSNPVYTQGVTVSCNETAVHVEVRKDVLGHDLSNIAFLTLGGCPAQGMDAASPVLIYESLLNGCKSMLTMTADELVYIFTLGMSPVPISGTPILRRASTRVMVQCHYPRFHNVSSSGLVPAWVPYSSAQAAEELLVFTLRLMTDDWLSERTSNQYYLGELINIEASVLQFNHVPLRVLMDGCVATTVPDINSVPRYFFIDNYGCLIDAMLTQSSSQFMPQTQANKLRFQLEAFGFQQTNTSLVYITCIMKATAASSPADSQHKACSFSGNGWIAAYGPNQVCSCCNSSCAGRKGRDLSARARRNLPSKKGLQLAKRVRLGPITVLENVW